MRGREVSVELQLESGEVLPEVEHNGAVYVVAQAGKTFSIVVKTLQESSHTTRVDLRVDGVDVGYGSNLTGKSSYAFKGVLTNSDARGVANMTAFQFAAAAELPEEGAPATSLDFDVGKITVTVSRTVQGARKQITALKNISNNSAQAPKLGDGKKWFLAPSLHATGGAASKMQMNFTPYHWIDGPQLEQLSLRYETASTLVLRKILDPSRADHQLLMGSSLQLEAELALKRAPPMAPAPGPRSVDLTQDAPAVKPEPGIKLQVARDEVACCDLTEDDAAPSWQVRKKPRIALDH